MPSQELNSGLQAYSKSTDYQLSYAAPKGCHWSWKLFLENVARGEVNILKAVCCRKERNDSSALLKLEPRIYHLYFLGFCCAEGTGSKQNKTFLLSIQRKALNILNCTSWRCIFEDWRAEIKRIFALPYSLLAIQIKASRRAVPLNTCIDMIIMSIDSDLAECGINKQFFIEEGEAESLIL
jgi:hypothetical protein